MCVCVCVCVPVWVCVRAYVCVKEYITKLLDKHYQGMKINTLYLLIQFSEKVHGAPMAVMSLLR